MSKNAETKKPSIPMREAYADAWNDILKELRNDCPEDSYPRALYEPVDEAKRVLSWHSDRWVTPAEWLAEAVLYVPVYNNFSAVRVFAWLDAHLGVKVRAARENSPALYVRGTISTLTALRNSATEAVFADEADIADKSGRIPAELRLWWD